MLFAFEHDIYFPVLTQQLVIHFVIKCDENTQHTNHIFSLGAKGSMETGHRADFYAQPNDATSTIGEKYLFYFSRIILCYGTEENSNVA